MEFLSVLPVFLLIALGHGQLIVNEKCPQVSRQYFPVRLFMGEWYQLLATPSNETYPKPECIYQDIRGGNFVFSINYFGYMENERYVTSSEFMSSDHLELFTPRPPFGPNLPKGLDGHYYWVSADSMGDVYYTVAYCGNLPSGQSFRHAWIYGRKNDTKNIPLDEISGKLGAYGITVSAMKQVQRDDCPNPIKREA